MAAGGQRVIAAIPARYGSTRFPAKPLAEICGKPMIQWTCARARAATLVDDVIVATDDDRIADCVRSFGGTAVMTSADHQTGTDRIHEAVGGVDADLVLNVQGDEPMVPPAVLDDLVRAMLDQPEYEMGTVAVPIDPAGEKFADPNVVKCVRAADGTALYFSRSSIPHARDQRPEEAMPLHHWGIYTYRRTFLERFVTLPRSPLERCESLEQLRALENGARIYVLVADEPTIGVDVPDDIAKVEALIRKEGLA